MEAVAKHDFIPTDSTELAFNKDDKLLILNLGDPDIQWFDAEKEGKKGLVPENYIQIEVPSWYHGRITRAEAEHRLQSNNHDGAFLVRLSESSPTDFSLSVKCSNSVQHFRILKDNEGKYFLWQKTFNSINELVENYRTETVSRTSNIYLRDMEFVVQALYDFEQTDEQSQEAELYFKQGELITVFDNTDQHWWGGRIGDDNSRTGFFPRSYVQVYRPNP